MYVFSVKKKMWCFVTVCVLCFVISTDAVTDEVIVEIPYNTTYSINKTISCHQDKEVTLTAFEGKPLIFSVQSDETNNGDKYIKCYKVDELETQLSDEQKVTFTIPAITKHMGGKWRCTTQSDECSINLHVRLERSPHKVLVNNMVLESTVSVLDESEFDHTYTHIYTDGDILNINCINEENVPVTRDIILKYVCSGQEKEEAQGFQPRLENLANCYILCIYKYENDISQTKVIFDHQPHDEMGYIKVNGSIGRKTYESRNRLNTLKYEFTYVFFGVEKVKISCHTDTEGLVVREKCDAPNTADKFMEKIIELPSTYTCMVCNITTKSKVKVFTADLKKRPLESMTSPSSRESTTNWNLLVIVLVILLILPVVLFYIVKKVKKHLKEKTTEMNNSQNTNGGIQQNEENSNLEYAQPYESRMNWFRENGYPEPLPQNQIQPGNEYTVAPKGTTTIMNKSQYANGGMAQTEENSNIEYVQPYEAGTSCLPQDTYAVPMPKNRRKSENAHTIPASFPIEPDTQYLNEIELASNKDQEVYGNLANDGETIYGNVLGDTRYVNN